MRAIQRAIRALADPKIGEHSQRFFKTGEGEYGEGDLFLGVRVPRLRELVRKHKEVTVEVPFNLNIMRSDYWLC